MNKLSIDSTALAILVCACLSGCQEPNSYVPPPPPQVTVAQPVQRQITDYKEYTGTTEAVESVQVRARVGGYLDSINFEFGEQVKVGDALYQIDPKPFQARLNQTRAEVAQAIAKSVEAKARYERAVPLVKSGSISREDLGEREAYMKVTEAGIIAARANEEVAALDLSYTEIRSPIAGRAGKTLVTVGNLVGNDEATHLTTIIKYDPIYANFTLSEADLIAFMGDRPRKAEKETKVFLRRSTDPEFNYEGRTEYGDLAVDAGTATFAVRAIFDNPDLTLVPGLSVVLRIPYRVSDNAIMVNEQAVGSDQQGKYVLIVNAENVVERRTVRLGSIAGGLQVVLEGIKPDDWVIVNGIQRARPGSKVDPQRTEIETSVSESPSIADDGSDPR